MVKEPIEPIPGIDEEDNFTGVAAWLTWAFEDRDYAEAERRQKAALRSWPALHLSRDYTEIYPLAAEESEEEVGGRRHMAINAHYVKLWLRFITHTP